MFEKQQQLARKKDVIARWFGEWDEVNGTAWQSAILGKARWPTALKKSAAGLERHAKQGLSRLGMSQAPAGRHGARRAVP